MSQPTSDRRAKVAAEIRAELARQNIPATALAKAINLSTATLSRRLRGDKPFYFEELEAVCAFLGFPLSELTARTDDAA